MEIRSDGSCRGSEAEKEARHYYLSLLSPPICFFRIPKEKLEFPCCCLTLTTALQTSALPGVLPHGCDRVRSSVKPDSHSHTSVYNWIHSQNTPELGGGKRGGHQVRSTLLPPGFARLIFTTHFSQRTGLFLNIHPCQLHKTQLDSKHTTG